MLRIIIVFCFVQISFAQLKLEEQPSIHGKKVKIYKVSDNAKELGYSLWMNKSKNAFKTKYFLDKDKFNAWKQGKTLVSICSAAFVKGGRPIGLAIDDGKKITSKVDYRMDALVVAHNDSISVLDLQQGNLRKMSKDYYSFLSWAESEKASVFQTQLLIHENSLRTINNSKRHAERRLLVLARDKNGDELHIIFNIARPVTLHEISKNILDYFEKTGVHIIALLNLDTGANDFIQVYNEKGDILPSFKGGRNASEITDLIVYYVEKD